MSIDGAPFRFIPKYDRSVAPSVLIREKLLVPKLSRCHAKTHSYNVILHQLLFDSRLFQDVKNRDGTCPGVRESNGKERPTVLPAHP